MSEYSISVLVVDDDTLIRIAMADQLDEAGFDVVQAMNASEALKILAEKKTDRYCRHRHSNAG